MLITIDEEKFEANSRLIGIRIATLSLRLMENWRKQTNDYDTAMILVSITAIAAEKLFRTGLEEELRNLKSPIAADRLSHCNVSSIAAATGINRETARRKINRLIANGWLVRGADGTIGYAPGFAQRESTMKLVRQQLETVRKAANDLMLYGAFAVSAGDPPGHPPPRSTGRRRRVDGRAGAP